MKLRELKIRLRASQIAGAMWEDIYDDPQIGSLADRLLACANHANHGSDGDLMEDDRRRLRKLAERAGGK